MCFRALQVGTRCSFELDFTTHDPDASFKKQERRTERRSKEASREASAPPSPRRSQEEHISSSASGASASGGGHHRASSSSAGPASSGGDTVSPRPVTIPAPQMPQIDTVPRGAIPMSRPSRTSHTRPKTVLVVDDVRMIREGAAEMLAE